MAKKKFSFLYRLIIYVAVLCCISFILLMNVKSILVDYENCQPENYVASVMEKVCKAIDEGNAEQYLDFVDGTSDSAKAEYYNLLKSGELTCKGMSGNVSSEDKSYAVFSGDSVLAKVTLRAVNEETKLILFPIVEWELVSVEPSLKVYNLELPASLSISVNGQSIAGTYNALDDTNSFTIQAMSDPEILITDAFGNSEEFTDGATLSLNDYTVELLSCYTLNVNGSPIEMDPVASEEFPAYEYVSEYCDAMPMLNTFEFSLLGDDADITVTDEDGKAVEFEQDGTKISCTEIKGEDTVPEELTEEFDVLEAAEQWSLFMSKDLTGGNYGFKKVAKYFEEDSYMYNTAYAWATGVDITFTSNHTLANPPFSDESVSNYVRYTDECYSCDVYLKKTFTTGKGNVVEDVLNSTFYMVKKDGSWIIVDMQEIVE